jgi:hypothetical protein
VLGPPPCPWHSLASGSVSISGEGRASILSDCRFAESVIKAFKGEKGIVEPTYVYLPGIPGGDAIAKRTGVDFFSVPVELTVINDQVILV